MRAVPLPVTVVMTALAATAGLAVGVLTPRLHPTVTIRVADGYATPVQAGASRGGWSYDVPLDVPWRDSSDSWHDSGRPACLPMQGATHHLRFATVTAKVEGVTWRQVVWVDCRT